MGKKKIQVVERPILISIICIIGFVGVVAALITATFPETSEKHSLLPLLYTFFSILDLIGFYLLWTMKKFGPYVLTAATVFTHISYIAIGVWKPNVLFFSSFVLIVSWYYYPKMK